MTDPKAAPTPQAQAGETEAQRLRRMVGDPRRSVTVQATPDFAQAPARDAGAVALHARADEIEREIMEGWLATPHAVFTQMRQLLPPKRAHSRQGVVRAIVGECVEVGSDEDGQPRLIIHTTMEAIRDFGPSLVFCDVRVSLADSDTHPAAASDDALREVVRAHVADLRRCAVVLDDFPALSKTCAEIETAALELEAALSSPDGLRKGEGS